MSNEHDEVSRSAVRGEALLLRKREPFDLAM